MGCPSTAGDGFWLVECCAVCRPYKCHLDAGMCSILESKRSNGGRMPVYEYFCRSCNTRYDKLRPLREADAPTTCPTCNEQNSVRALSVFITISSESRSAGGQAMSHGGCACGGACSCASKN